MSVARDVLIKALANYPQNAALSLGNSTYSYAELLVNLEDTITDALSACGHTGSLGVLADKSLNGYRAVAGALLSGQTYIPLNVKYPDARNLAILERSGTSLLVVDAAFEAVAARLNTQLGGVLDILVIDHDEHHTLTSVLHPAERDQRVSMDPRFDDLAYLLFTSGSTGEPKGVPVSNGNLLAYLDNICTVFEFREDDRFSQFFDFTFDLSVHDLMVCWQNGACLCPPTKAGMLMPLHFAKSAQLSVWFSVPSLALTAKDLLGDKFSEFVLPSLRCSLFCGEALPQTLAQQWQKIASGPLINLYGPTEATIAFTAHEYSDADTDYSVVPIGKPFGTNQISLLDAAGNAQPQAELCLGGDQVFAGYWMRDDLTEKAFHQRANQTPWYRSGDVASLRDDAVLVYHGRADRQVQVGGFRVELQEVEHVLRNLTDRGELGVIAYPVSDIGEARGLIAFVRGEALDTQAIRAACQQDLPTYMIPSDIVALDELPYNANGKLDYKQLYKVAEQRTA
ncbi:D-alanine--poly(phosphoribitol) ligase [Arenicella chitinivorans]|uniref:D-alanine--poly(Phosphoribitol) ligase n=1 Tax=Arenicella chitinivorans TaxID=1329800 RepID=A0A918VF07_9GAMM|nr:AMP-binding protein [Arenicella chitinivorans]GGZ96009.1 D-alanine--poly(phosphoribitol) ligase [Arenicella chitinivorans]